MYEGQTNGWTRPFQYHSQLPWQGTKKLNWWTIDRKPWNIMHTSEIILHNVKGSLSSLTHVEKLTMEGKLFNHSGNLSTDLGLTLWFGESTDLCWKLWSLRHDDAHKMRHSYNTVNFLQNPHKRHPIACLLKGGMHRLLRVQTLIYILPQ